MGYKSKKRQSKKVAAPTRGDAGGEGGGGAGARGSGMPAGLSWQASAATTRVSTQLQILEYEIKYLLKRATASEEAERCWREVVNKQKEVDKELRSQLAAEERARVEADILRRKHDKKVARLKAKIRLMFESNGSEAEFASSEGSGSDEEGGGQKPGRERPAGLSYKLREATTRATVRKFIDRKAEPLEAWLTHAIGDDDSWPTVYAEGGPGAQFGAPSGGDGGAEQRQQHGDVDAHGADGEEAGIVEEADLVGQPADPAASEFSRKCGKSTTVDGLPVVGEEALVSAVTEAMYDRMNGHGHHMELPTGYSVGPSDPKAWPFLTAFDDLKVYAMRELHGLCEAHFMHPMDATIAMLCAM
eukprot:jgi/Tetstr1/449449/TSEL_036544.t1